MKTLTLLSAAILCSLLSFGQNVTGPIQSTVPIVIPHAFTSAENNQFASSENMQFTSNFYSDGRGEGKCARYQHMKTAGIIVASIGGGLLVTGIALTAVGIGSATNGYYGNTGVYYDGTASPLIGLGGACIGLGIVGLGAGIPLAIIGSVKTRKYCSGAERARERSYMELTTKGNGLALNF